MQMENIMVDIVIPGLEVKLQTGHVIALQADDGQYLSRINRGNINPIEAAKISIDEFSRFKVVLFLD